ncbi:alpha/beta hydrolase [Sphingomonas sp.]|uniref:alpha/beta fold hydrolase n=1 Tax=Sphingomonas sp. TaxID=28214 RepID=UPI0025FA6644|nr:alpha/beta hydrolase [Sphingomonas sp.]
MSTLPLSGFQRGGMSVLIRNNVHVAGQGDRAIVFAHGFGCDQNMWRFVAPAFEAMFKVVLFDHVGAGGSQLSAYDSVKYDSLQAYAGDLVEIGRELDLRGAIFVGHSVSAMIGIFAAASDPTLFSELVLVCPSPRYIDDATYHGGFSAADIDELLESLADNHPGWSAMMAPVSDNRKDLAGVAARTLILQCRDDAIASTRVGEYVRDHIADSELVVLDATGHCPNLSAPQQEIAAIKAFV